MAAEFTNRTEAGRALAKKLNAYAGAQNVLVLALPRGGVPVGYEVAEALKVPLDIVLVRKIGVPYQPELAMGAIVSGGGYTLNRDVVDELQITSDEFSAEVQRESEELHRRERLYRAKRPPIETTGKTLIVVDDGIATGSSMRAAIMGLRREKPAKIIAAIPVAPAESVVELAQAADEVVCLLAPEPFRAVGQHYMNFGQVGDTEVRELLDKSARRTAA